MNPMYDLILYGNAENERGRLELCLTYENGVKITAENHDGYTWETDTFDPVETIIKIFKFSNREERNRIMAVDFSAFDEKVDLGALQKEVDEAPDVSFSDVPDGVYIVSIEKMEIKQTKAKDKLMFAVQCKIKEGDQQGRMIFFNRVILGNKTTEKWNDGRAIKSVCTWVNELLSEDDDPVVFVNYTDFAGQILEVFQSIQGAIELEVKYAANAFNPITINEVFDL